MWIAVLVLPLWLLVGWGVFEAGGWTFLWVLFIAIPSVFFGQLMLAVLTRSRPTVAASGALSWWDVLGFTVWHLLTIFVGTYNEQWFPLALVSAIAAGVGLFALQLWQLRREAATIRVRMGRQRADDDPDVMIIEEHRRDD